MSEMIEQLKAALDEDEQRAIPQTVVHSGGEPAPVVPNCIGPTGNGCPASWRIDPAFVPVQEWAALKLEHQLTHASPAQRQSLAMVAAVRELIAQHEQTAAWYNQPQNRNHPAGEVHGLYTALKLIAKGYGIEAPE